MRFFSRFIAMGLPFGVGMGLYYATQYGAKQGLILGAIAGVLFGVAMAFFMERQSKRLGSGGEDFEGEEVLMEGMANRRGKGGWLTQTPTRLAFRCLGKNAAEHSLDLQLASLAGVEARNTLGIIPNAIEVEVNEGASERLVVSGRSAWLRSLNEALIARDQSGTGAE